MARNPIFNAVAAFLVGAQAALGVVGALALIASARRWRAFAFGAEVARHRAGAGLLLLVVSVAAAIVAIALASRASWARTAALVLEGVVAFAALLRLAVHPGAAIVSLLVAGTIIALLLLSESGAGAPRGGDSIADNTQERGGTVA